MFYTGKYHKYHPYGGRRKRSPTHWKRKTKKTTKWSKKAAKWSKH